MHLVVHTALAFGIILLHIISLSAVSATANHPSVDVAKVLVHAKDPVGR